MLGGEIAGERVLAAVRSAEEFLLQGQTLEGFWCDYPGMQPGASEGWTTGVVGYALTCLPASNRVVQRLRRAADALDEIGRPEGWGYNRRTACDGDSTAWVWRFLSRIDDLGGRDAVRDLHLYITEDGETRTFRGEEFGSWTGSHPEVTAVLGLGLIATGAAEELVGNVRAALLKRQAAPGLWPAFWWTTESYANAACLEFLDTTGGVPPEIALLGIRWLQGVTGSYSFDVAQELSAACILRAESPALERGSRLLEMQLPDGGWSASRTLRVPEQHASEGNQFRPAFADEHRVMSTAMAMMALKRWLLRAGE